MHELAEVDEDEDEDEQDRCVRAADLLDDDEQDRCLRAAGLLSEDDDGEATFNRLRGEAGEPDDKLDDVEDERPRRVEDQDGGRHVQVVDVDLALRRFCLSVWADELGRRKRFLGFFSARRWLLCDARLCTCARLTSRILSLCLILCLLQTFFFL